MRVKCAYCEKWIDGDPEKIEMEFGYGVSTREKISHGCCKKCYKIEKKKLKEMLDLMNKKPAK